MSMKGLCAIQQLLCQGIAHYLPHHHSCFHVCVRWGTEQERDIVRMQRVHHPKTRDAERERKTELEKERKKKGKGIGTRQGVKKQINTEPCIHKHRYNDRNTYYTIQRGRHNKSLTLSLSHTQKSDEIRE